MNIPLPQLINAGLIRWSSDLSAQVDEIVAQTSRYLIDFNQAFEETDRRDLLDKLFNSPLKPNTSINPPFQTDFGAHTFIGKNVFINRDSFFVDLGGIYIEDNVLIGPRVMLISVGHNKNIDHRRDLFLKAVHIKNGAWIGANVTVLPGVSIGENSIVGAGAVVTKDVPANVIVTGVPAKILRTIH